MIFLLLPHFFYCQNSQLIKGKITDSLKSPLEFANILAIPEIDNQDIKFAITNNEGEYKLQLLKNYTYRITVSYLGYKSQTLTLTTDSSNIIKNFILLENPNQLQEITLNYTPPVSVKKDTIIYKVDAFATGKERKLREVLKKLPGLEVDREGNVRVQGKKVTKVLVENKSFFTGNSKLAVNNIPADAVDKVEILDNYNEVAMLKGLQDSEDMAMNIKLKEDKKKFIFGDLEVGSGYKKRYLIHPNLFYYSPKTNVNLIGDFNNQGIKSFTLRDYLEFEGGFGKLINNTKSYFGLFKSDFAQYLNNQDFVRNTNKFGALSIRQSLNTSTDINGYIISSYAKTETRENTLNTYQTTITPFTEDRTVTNNLNNNFTIGKITLDYNPSYKEDFAYNVFVKATTNSNDGIIHTINPSQTNRINIVTDATSLNIKQNISYSRKLSKKHTATLEATYNFYNDKPLTEWITNQQILQGLIPLEDDTIYAITQNKTSKAHNFSAIAKDYWVLSNFNHIYTSIGLNTAFSNFYSKDAQLLSNGNVNNFNTNGFGNDFNYNLVNTFIGLEYKFQIGITTFKPMLYYHFYNWTTKNFEDKTNNNKALLLPQFTTKIEFSNSGKINFRYALNTRFPYINQLASNYVLNSFNTVFRGDNTLENQRYHTVSLSYYKFSLFKNININASMRYNKKIEHLKPVTELDGINQYTTNILFNRPEENWALTGHFSKKIKRIKYSFKSSFNYNDFYQIVNNNRTLNIAKNISNTLSAETFFKKFPNIEIGYTKDFSDYRSQSRISKFENDSFFTFLEYSFLNDFNLKADYRFDTYKNKSAQTKSVFDIANVSLFYQKEDSPWGFEVNATNIFDIKFKQQNTFNNFIISDSKTFILPRIIMFKIAYKL
ncbi:carboxypeptidase-like regulatory domain-containing protein [Seonamhaeicola marinus]|uniref:Carboxypeptidase-like regulatory domain-containing protein n=1 Tax=Seonamhaeicola marinus TaxID=1912246 RepID=A0A5D0HT14_9FLAO|nr:carboxypeptidase-like regulatory domain-containing protein [Seonamhaeicola marinus]TYA74415.1 carboxypeptidase-like regulatory domain-containing protein [Seonamhaeicola marinus]